MSRGGNGGSIPPVSTNNFKPTTRTQERGRIARGVDLRVPRSVNREETKMPRGSEAHWRRQIDRRERALAEAREWLFGDESVSAAEERELLKAYSF